MELSIATLDAGVQLSYIDSGPPSKSPYTTLVCVHGHTYTAQNFSRTLSLAPEKGLRVIAVNRRDYALSTWFSAEELSVIKSRDDTAHADFLRDRGLEIAQFLAHLVKEKGLPMVGEDGSGGIALLGWSLGNIVTLAFLRHFSSYPADLQDILRPYLKHFFIYEGGTDALGYAAPEGAYHPLRDASLPKRTRGLEFGTWVSSYYKHAAYSLGINVQDPHTIQNLSVRTPRDSDVYKLSTLDRLAPKELLSCIDARAGDRSEQPFWETVTSGTLYDNTRGALTQHDAPSQLKVTLLHGRASIWSVQWAAWKLEDDLKQWDEEGQPCRPVAFLALDEGNHFLHWDDPNVFLDSIVKAMDFDVTNK